MIQRELNGGQSLRREKIDLIRSPCLNPEKCVCLNHCLFHPTKQGVRETHQHPGSERESWAGRRGTQPGADRPAREGEGKERTCLGRGCAGCGRSEDVDPNARRGQSFSLGASGEGKGGPERPRKSAGARDSGDCSGPGGPFPPFHRDTGGAGLTGSQAPGARPAPPTSLRPQALDREVSFGALQSYPAEGAGSPGARPITTVTLAMCIHYANPDPRFAAGRAKVNIL